MQDVSTVTPGPPATEPIVLPAAEDPATGPALVHAQHPGGSSNKRTLEALRGLAAMAVLVFHLGKPMAALGVHIPGYLAGETGVQMFFVLSGYLIGSSVLAPTRFSGRDYSWKRVFRILPLYYFSILFGLLLVNAGPLMSRSGLKDIAVHLVLLQILSTHYRGSINGVLWTLSIEWLFYIFMLVIAGTFRRHTAGWVVAEAMVVLGLGWRVWIWLVYQGHPAALNDLYKQLPGLADVFGCGMILALIMHDPHLRAWCSRLSVAALGLIASVVAMVVLLVVFDANSPSATREHYWSSPPMIVFWPFAFAVACAGVVLFIQRFELGLRPVLRWTGLGYLGLISYSLYIMHTYVVTNMFRSYAQAQPDVPAWLMIPAVIAMSILLCSVTFYLVEQPFMRVRRRVQGRGPRSTAPDHTGDRGSDASATADPIQGPPVPPVTTVWLR